MADRFYNDLEIPDFPPEKTVSPPDVGFIQIYAQGGALVLRRSDDTDVVINSSFDVAQPLEITNTDNSTSTITGALTVAGGVGIAGNLALGGGLYANSSLGSAGQVLTSTGTGVEWSTAGSTFNGGTITNPLTIDNATISTSPTTGALIVDGGAGIGGDLHTGGDLHIVGTGTLRFNDIDVLGFDDHVWYVSDGVGNDLNNGHREYSAFRTIKKALSVADFGDTIFILPGIYEEIFPLTVPAGVSVRGSGLRETQVKPTLATNDLDAFLLNGDTTVKDLTVRDFFYNSTNDTGYGFKFASGTSITERSPYIERVTVLTKGSVTSSSDPYGFNQGDAGRGAYVDGAVVSRSSIQAAMLFNESTFIVPDSRAIIMTNGARVEWLTCFTYFADLAIEGKVGTTGRGGDGKTYLTFAGISGPGFSVGETIRFIGTGGTPTVDFTVEAVSGSKVTVDGNLTGLAGLDLSPGAGGSITGLTSGTTATEITRYDRSEFAAELRSISSANIYGNQGVRADGADVILQLMAHNFAYIGTGADLTNDKAAVVQANEVIEANGGRVYFNSSDQSGDFRVGDLFRVNFETGEVTFDGGTFDVTALGTINFVDGADQTTVTAAGITTGNLSFAGNSITTSTGNLTLDPAGSGTIALNGGTTVTGAFTATGATALTANTASTSTTTGTLVVTGGAGVSGTIYAGGFNGPLTGNVTGTSSLATDVAGGAANQVLYQTATNDTAFTVAPTVASTYLRWNGTAFDWTAVTASAAGSAGQIQFNTAGSLAASASLTFDTATNTLGLLGTDTSVDIVGVTNEPAIPPANTLTFYAKNIGGRMMPKWVGPSGFDTPFQPLLALNKVAWWNPPGNATTVPGIVGLNPPTAAGTAQARNVATTNVLTRSKRLGYNSATQTGNAAGHYNVQAQFTIGTGTLGVGGFYYVCRFGSGVNRAGDLVFVGLTSSIAAPSGSVSPATLTNCIGVGAAVGDTNMSIYYGGSAAQTPIALGAGFPKNDVSTIYEIILFAASNVNDEVSYRVTNIETGAQTSGTLTATTPGVQLPLSTTLLAHRCYRGNGATTGATQMDIVSVYIETDT